MNILVFGILDNFIVSPLNQFKIQLGTFSSTIFMIF